MKRTLMIAVLLVLALGGSAAAAGKITGKHIKNGTVTGVDLRDGSVLESDIADGSLVAADLGELPAGPPGPAGERGPQGPRGVPGADGAPGLQYVITERVVEGLAPLAHVSATCPAAKDVLGGGVSTLDPSHIRVVQSAPLRDGNGWFGHVFLAAQSQTTVYVWAVCADLS